MKSLKFLVITICILPLSLSLYIHNISIYLTHICIHYTTHIIPVHIIYDVLIFFTDLLLGCFCLQEKLKAHFESNFTADKMVLAASGTYPDLKTNILRLFQHTELEHTPSNLYQQAISRDSFHSWRTGDGPGCVLGVRCNLLGNMLLMVQKSGDHHLGWKNNLVNNEIFSISTGAGFLPSTVAPPNQWLESESCPFGASFLPIFRG